MRASSPLHASLALVLVSACAVEPNAGESLHKASTAVVFGETADPDEIRGTVVLVDANQGFPFCSGTLIAPEVVLTAAHCLVVFDEDGFITGPRSPDEIVIASGITSISQATRSDITAVDEAIVHPSFARGPFEDERAGFGNLDDVGLLHLTQPIENVDVIPVLDPRAVAREMFEGADVIIEGFGTANTSGTAGAGILRLAEVPLVRVGRDEFIAGGPGSADACPGDSGGPVYLEVDDVTYVVGVTSRSLPDAPTRCGGGGIYTLAPAYVDFLRANAAVDVVDADADDDDEEDEDEEDDEATAPITGLGDGQDDDDGSALPSERPADDEEDEDGDTQQNVSPATTSRPTVVGGCNAGSSLANESLLSTVFTLLVLVTTGRQKRRTRVKGT